MTKDLADIWPFQADYKYDDVIYLIKSEESEPVTSANATKLNTPVTILREIKGQNKNTFVKPTCK